MLEARTGPKHDDAKQRHKPGHAEEGPCGRDAVMTRKVRALKARGRDETNVEKIEVTVAQRDGDALGEQSVLEHRP